MLATRIRLATDPDRVDAGLLNLLNAGAVTFWRGSELHIEFAVLDGAVLDDLSDLADVTCRVKTSQDASAALLLSKTIYSGDLTPDITLDQWKANTAQHGAFVFTSAETSVPMTRAVMEAWMVIVATLTDGSSLVLGAGKVSLHDPNYAATDPPPEYPPSIVLSGPQGDKGWSPILAVASDGQRRVLQVSDWTGGAGTKPAAGLYLGTSGLVSSITDGVDIRGITFPGITSLAYDDTNKVLNVVTTGGSFFIPLNIAS